MRPHTPKQGLHRGPALASLSLAIACALLAPGGARANTTAGPEEVTFNRAFLDEATLRNIERFERGATLPPGDYAIEVFVNKHSVGRQQLRLVETQQQPAPCLSMELLAEWGVKAARAAMEAGGADDACVDLAALVPQATATLNAANLQLTLSIPQAALDRTPRGYVDPRHWDDGVTAATFNYSLSSYRRQSDTTGSQLSTSLRMNSGLSVGGWRLRHDSTYSWLEGRGGHLQTIAAYARHDLTALRSKLIVGRSNTGGELFDSVGFDGVQLSSDDRMLPDSMAGFAPVVRGVARTNANVVIRQSGYVVYEAAVAPGPFEISDLYASGFAGDLEVTVTESDGASSRFTVPYAAVPRLLRPGQARYAAVAGKLRDNGYAGASDMTFLEATYQRGLSNALTGFGGVQATSDGNYLSGMAGIALNTRLGAFSSDVTFSSAQLPTDSGRRSGHSVRATYSKSLPTTGTSVAVAAYRHSSEGYLSLREAASRIATAELEGPGLSYLPVHRKNTFQLSVSQTLADGYGTLYFSGSSNNYWDRGGADTTFQAGYSNRLGSGTYSVGASRTRDAMGQADNQLNLTYSVPLWKAPAAPNVNLQFDRHENGSSWNAGVTGNAGERSQYHYNASLSGGDGQRPAWSAGGGYYAPYATLTVGTSHTAGSSSQSFGMAGGVVAHRGGLTLAPSLSETIAIVDARGAAGARVGNVGKVDRHGYAIVTSLSPYRKNTVTLDPSTAKEMIELDTTRQHIAPRAGAVARLTFEGGEQRMQLLQAHDEAGNKLPFGAEVFDPSGALVGSVAQGGLVYVQQAAPGLQLDVKWGGQQDRTCRLTLPVAEDNASESEVTSVTCHADAGARS